MYNVQNKICLHNISIWWNGNGLGTKNKLQTLIALHGICFGIEVHAITLILCLRASRKANIYNFAQTKWIKWIIMGIQCEANNVQIRLQKNIQSNQNMNCKTHSTLPVITIVMRQLQHRIFLFLSQKFLKHEWKISIFIPIKVWFS